MVPLRTSNDNIDDGTSVQVQDDDRDDQNVAFFASTLSYGNANFEVFSKRKSQFEEEELVIISLERRCVEARLKNKYQISNIGMASEVDAGATSSEMQSVFDGAIVKGNNEGNNQVGYGAPLSDDSEGIAEGVLKDDDFLVWLNDMINFNN